MYDSLDLLRSSEAQRNAVDARFKTSARRLGDVLLFITCNVPDDTRLTNVRGTLSWDGVSRLALSYVLPQAFTTMRFGVDMEHSEHYDFSGPVNYFSFGINGYYVEDTWVQFGLYDTNRMECVNTEQLPDEIARFVGVEHGDRFAEPKIRKYVTYPATIILDV